ncbi:MAG: triose-phosphate isomerase family protein, partial [Luteibaculum sp.]
QRKSNGHFRVVAEQVHAALADLKKSDFENLIWAYEPVWAIGTGETASPQQAQEMHAFIRTELHGIQPEINNPILYGGSCKPENASEIFAEPDVNGGLIGGASLKADDFIAIAKSF